MKVFGSERVFAALSLTEAGTAVRYFGSLAAALILNVDQIACFRVGGLIDMIVDACSAAAAFEEGWACLGWHPWRVEAARD